MMSLELIVNKLEKEGYVVDIREYDNIQYVIGGINDSEGVLKIGNEIKIYIENGSIIFLESIGQTYEKMEFTGVDEVVLFVKRKFPISK